VLLVALLASATLNGVWNVAVGSYQWATMGVERANAVYLSPRPVPLAQQRANEELRVARQGTSFLRLAAARVVVVYWNRTDLWGDWQRGNRGQLLFSLMNHLPLFLIGLLAFRLGVFAQPADHRRLLVAVMLAGAAVWAVHHWQLSRILWPAPLMISVVQVARPIQSWFGLGGMEWPLALTYMAAITLLVGFSKAWERRLTAIFGAAGRMALSNYLLHFVVLSLIFDNYGFGVTRKALTPQFLLAAAVILFATLAIFSRWWLARFRIGPAEWVLRSLTYACLQPLRRPAAQGTGF